jgi:hypothetical protein
MLFGTAHDTLNRFGPGVVPGTLLPRKNSIVRAYRPGLSGLSSTSYTGTPWIINPTFGLFSSSGGLLSGTYGSVILIEPNSGAVIETLLANNGITDGNFAVASQSTSGGTSVVTLKNPTGDTLTVTINLHMLVNSTRGTTSYSPSISSMVVTPAPKPVSLAPGYSPPAPVVITSSAPADTPVVAPSSTPLPPGFPPLDPGFGYVLVSGETTANFPGGLDGTLSDGGLSAAGLGKVFPQIVPYSQITNSPAILPNPGNAIAIAIAASDQYDRWEFSATQNAVPGQSFITYILTFKNLSKNGPFMVYSWQGASGNGTLTLLTIAEDLGAAILAGGLVNLAVGGAVGAASGIQSGATGASVIQSAEQSAEVTAAVSAAGMAAGAVDLAIAPAAATLPSTTAADGSLFVGSDTITATAADTATTAAATTAGTAGAGGTSLLSTAGVTALGVGTKAAAVIGSAAVSAAIADVTGKKPPATAQPPQAAQTLIPSNVKAAVPGLFSKVTGPMLAAGGLLAVLIAKHKS